jgi:acetyltransferase-like isoleucine patch superfamily enzyme
VPHFDAANDAFVHPTALVPPGAIGAGTRIWAFTNVQSGASIGDNCTLGDHCFVESGATIGDCVTIKNGNAIWDGIVLENGTFVGPGVVFTNDLHPRSPRLPEASERYADRAWLERTIIRRGASIGGGAVIVAGITIGEFALVAAGATVTRDVRAHALMVGSPARVAGWICSCGQRLVVDGLTATCRSCDRTYETDGGCVVPPGSSEPTPPEAGRRSP